MKEVKGVKVFNSLVRFLNANLSDGDTVVLRAYLNIPEGHALNQRFNAVTLQNVTKDINDAKPQDDLQVSADASRGFAPSEVKGIKWGGSKPNRGYLMVETGKLDAKEGDDVTINDVVYTFIENMPWESFRTHFVLVAPKPVAPKATPKVTAKAKAPKKVAKAVRETPPPS